LSLPLAERGIRVVGVDLISDYVEQATNEAARRGLECRFHRGDAFEFAAPEPCHAAFNWFTSFGYLEDDDLNSRMLQRVFESLKPGGRFLLDYLNMPRIFTEFHPSYLQWQNPEDRGGLVVLTENKMDFARGMMDSLWTFVHGDGRREPRPVVTRMYLPHELVRMLRRCGFEGIELFGSVAGEPFGLRSARCIVLARKP
jgi:SAM-dependent methyltransferase